MVEDPAIQAIMTRTADPQRCASQLVNEAIAAGGNDNVTVVVVDIEGKREAHRKKIALKTKLTIAFVLVLLAAIVAGAAWGVNAYVHNSAYLAEEDGNVAIYQGLPEPFLLVSYSELVEKTDVPVDKLSPGVADRIREGLRVDNVDAARELIEEYRDQLSPDGGKTTVAKDSTASSDERNADSGSNSADSDHGSDSSGNSADEASSHSTSPSNAGSNALSAEDVAQSGEGA